MSSSRRRKFLVVLILVVTMVVAFGMPGQVGAGSVPTLLAVARGGPYGDNDLINFNTYSAGSWQGWTQFPSGASSTPTLCVPDPTVGLAYGTAYLIWRGLGDHIFQSEWTTGQQLSTGGATIHTGWSGISEAPTGTTIDQPACVINLHVSGNSVGYVYVVVRGGNNALYFNQMCFWLPNTGCSFPYWGKSWVPLGGATHSAPTLTFGVYNGQMRLDLFVRGTDNGIWHKAAAITGDGGSVQWAADWDEAPTGSPLTPSAIAATGEQGTNVCVDVVVQGTDNKIYLGGVCPTGTSSISGNWKKWLPLGGATLMAPSVLWNYCDSGGETVDAFVMGTNSQPYGYSSRTFPAYWTGAGGETASPVSVTWNGMDDAVLLRGTNNAIYFNQFYRGKWTGYVRLGGLTTTSTPAITNIAYSGFVCTQD